MRRSGCDGEHLILRLAREEHQLWLPDPPAEGAPLAAVVPLDQDAPSRAEASVRFFRHANGQSVLDSPKKRRDERRIVDTLRALDGHLSGATYRAIAECLFGPSRIAAEPWKTASVRDATIRLVRKGVALMRGGYRDLLRRRNFD